jgi:hypothetical protein
MSAARLISRDRIAPKGWLTDPMDQTRQRFWSGQQWLDYSRDPRHPARLVKSELRTPCPPPTVDPSWKLALTRFLVPAICALTAGVLLAAFIAYQQQNSEPVKPPVAPTGVVEPAPAITGLGDISSGHERTS